MRGVRPFLAAGLVLAMIGAACTHLRHARLPPEELRNLFHICLAYPAPGSLRTPILLEEDGVRETLYVEERDVISLAHVTRVWITRQDSVLLVFELTDEGQRQMALATRGHVGKRMAVFLARKLHSAPVVQAPVSGRFFSLSGGSYTDEQLGKLERTLQHALGIFRVPSSRPTRSSLSGVGGEALSRREKKARIPERKC
jgi:hypothetical protein